MPGMVTTSSATTVSPSHYLNIPQTNYHQLSGQQSIPVSSPSVALGTTPLTTGQKHATPTRDVTSNEATQSDVMSFSEHLFD
jgi:hypothetical protein